MASAAPRYLLEHRFHMGFPPGAEPRRRAFSIEIDLRVTTVDLLIGGAIAMVTLWLALRNESPAADDSTDDAPAAELEPVARFSGR